MGKARLGGMPAFVLIWIGQLLSLLGSGMTGFGLAIWAWQKTGLATALALVGFFFAGATMVASPLAGVIVDRFNRKVIMIVADLAAGLSTVAILVLLLTGRLEIWHLYVVNVFSGAFQALQWPAYSAAITMLIPKKQYGRASGMMSVAESASVIVSPVLAAIFMGLIGLGGVIAIDVATMALAIVLLLFIHVPQPGTTAAGRQGRGSVWKEAAFGFRYIFDRPSLLGLQLVFFAGNLISSFAQVAVVPMIMLRTGDDKLALGAVQSVAGIGMLAGSVLMSIWGGPKRKVHGVLIGHTLMGLFGFLLLGLGRGMVVWSVAALIGFFFIPLVNASNQAIWQAKVAPDVQGRVFSVRRLIAQVSSPLAMVAGGPLADYIFKPAMQPGGSMAPLFGWMVGAGPGAGMALMIVLAGVLGAVAGLVGYAFRAIREAETILPDHGAEAAPEAVPEAVPVGVTAVT